MTALLVIVIGTVLVNTFLLTRRDQALDVAEPQDVATATLIALPLAVALTQALAWMIPSALRDVLVLIYALCALVAAVTVHAFKPTRAPLLVVGNCLALGVVLLNASGTATSIAIVMFAIALGLGFALLLSLFVALNARADQDVPAPFRDAPITLISAGITALALMGFTGLWRG
jgi:Na+-translocating ferredoxin:NAD+ oxidoreductase subunit A